MKKSIFKITVMAVALGAAGCSGSFLSEEPNGYISTPQMEKNATTMNNLVLGMYANMPKAGTGGTTDHDDFGQKSVDITTDIMCGDMAMPYSNYGWFRDAEQLESYLSTSYRTAMVWRYYYRVIKSANDVFDLLGSDTIPPADEDLLPYYGQAKAMRAYAYFFLANYYAGPYDEDKAELVLPIYHTQRTEATEPLSTLQAVYELIEGDLLAAIDALDGFERNQLSRVDADVAQGLLAYAYLAMGENEKAARYAQNVIKTGRYELLPYDQLLTTGFRSVETPGWMWASDITQENTSGLGSFWGHVDIFTYSYAAAGDDKRIDDNLFLSIMDHSPTDQRFYWFLYLDDPIIMQYFAGNPVGKFFAKERELGEAGLMGDQKWLNDVCYMRIEEMYLVAAEAYARGGNEPEARTALKTLLEQRDPEYAATVVDGLTGDALLDAVYHNWRVEMWGEGRGLMTMKRFKKTVTRAQNHYAHGGETISYRDKRLTFEIPEVEIVNNPHLVPRDTRTNPVKAIMLIEEGQKGK